MNCVFTCIFLPRSITNICGVGEFVDGQIVGRQDGSRISRTPRARCVCVRVYVYLFVCVCMCARVCVRVGMRACPRVHVHTCGCVRMLVWVIACMIFLCVGAVANVLHMREQSFRLMLPHLCPCRPVCACSLRYLPFNCAM